MPEPSASASTAASFRLVPAVRARSRRELSTAAGIPRMVYCMHINRQCMHSEPAAPCPRLGGSASVEELQARDQRLEARVIADAIKLWLGRRPGDVAGALVERPGQPLEATILVPEREIGERYFPK